MFKKNLFTDCSQPKSAVKNNTKSRFSYGVMKKCTHAHKLIKTQNLQNKIKKKQNNSWEEVPTAQKSHKKQ